MINQIDIKNRFLAVYNEDKYDKKIWQKNLKMLFHDI